MEENTHVCGFCGESLTTDEVMGIIQLTRYSEGEFRPSGNSYSSLCKRCCEKLFSETKWELEVKYEN